MRGPVSSVVWIFLLFFTGSLVFAGEPSHLFLASADSIPLVLPKEEGFCPCKDKVDHKKVELAQYWEEEKAKEAGAPAKTIQGTMPDPFQPLNRGFFWINNRLYFDALKPIARLYGFILPEQVRIGVRHAISNLHAPIRFANSVLQLKMKKAGTVLCRFVINSTVGIAGFLDPATDMGLAKVDEDAGQTLGVYGLKEVFYIDIPILGPSCVRDALGYIADTFMDPLYYLLNTWTYLGLYALNKVNETSLTIGTYEGLIKSAIDPYIAVRNAYYQYRRQLIKH